MPTTALAIAAVTWAVLMALGPLLQIRVLVRRRSSQGLSVAYFGVLLVGFALWVAYGVATDTRAGDPERRGVQHGPGDDRGRDPVPVTRSGR